MGKWVHRLSEIDPSSRTAICVACGPVTIRKKRENAWRCNRAHVPRNRIPKNKPYRKYKGFFCNRCGFVALVPHQLDVHHKDHNHDNNDPTNLETVCANCHRLIHALDNGATVAAPRLSLERRKAA